MGLRLLPNCSTLSKRSQHVEALEVLDTMRVTLIKIAEEANGTACRDSVIDATRLGNQHRHHYICRSERRRQGFVKVRCWLAG